MLVQFCEQLQPRSNAQSSHEFVTLGKHQFECNGCYVEPGIRDRNVADEEGAGNEISPRL